MNSGPYFLTKIFSKLMVVSRKGMTNAFDIWGTSSLDGILSLGSGEFWEKLESFQAQEISEIDFSNLQLEPMLEKQFVFGTGCNFIKSEEQLKNIDLKNIYDKIYIEHRPMLFIKGFPHTVSSQFEDLILNDESSVTIPEAELCALFNSSGEVIGYSVSNDFTFLDFELENPLYLTQSKLASGSCGLLPFFLISKDVPDGLAELEVFRNEKLLYSYNYELSGLKRSPEEIISWIQKMKITPLGGVISLGCGASYPVSKSLIPGDLVQVSASFLPIKLSQTASLSVK